MHPQPKMRNRAPNDAKSVSRISVSKPRSSVQQDIGKLEAYFTDFVSNPETQNLRYVMKILSEDRIPTDIPCRKDQKEIIEGFILNAISMTYSPEVLYIAGVPGIGKTICVKNVIQKVESSAQFNKDKVKFIYVNAMMMKAPEDVFRSILNSLTDVPVKVDSKKACYLLNDYFEKGISASGIKVSPNVTKILVIDEMDYLKTDEQQVIYTIVEWIRHKKSHLSIIGLSNTVDLPESFSLKIASRFGNKRLIFPQYTIKEIGQILEERLRACEGVFNKQAIEYICKKIGGQQTDIRKCLHIMRQSINKFLGKTKFKGKSREVYLNNIPEFTVREVVRELYYDSFVDSFAQFPMAYKVVLACMAAYFREERQAMAYSQLESMLGTNIIHSVNQLRSILFDLKDLGLISIKYMVLKSDNRVFKEFKIPKNVEEEFITLLVDVDKIVMAYQAEERENKQAFNPLDRWRTHFSKKNNGY